MVKPPKNYSNLMLSCETRNNVCLTTSNCAEMSTENPQTISIKAYLFPNNGSGASCSTTVDLVFVQNVSIEQARAELDHC